MRARLLGRTTALNVDDAFQTANDGDVLSRQRESAHKKLAAAGAKAGRQRVVVARWMRGGRRGGDGRVCEAMQKIAFDLALEQIEYVQSVAGGAFALFRRRRRRVVQIDKIAFNLKSILSAVAKFLHRKFAPTAGEIAAKRKIYQPKSTTIFG